MPDLSRDEVRAQLRALGLAPIDDDDLARPRAIQGLCRRQNVAAGKDRRRRNQPTRQQDWKNKSHETAHGQTTHRHDQPKYPK